MIRNETALTPSPSPSPRATDMQVEASLGSPTSPIPWRRPGRRATLLHTLAAIAIVAAPACGPAVEPVSPPPPAPATSSIAVAPPASPKLEIAPDASAAARIAADIKFLASPELAGRGTGEEGARKAADYVAKRFADLKIAPFGDSDDKGQKSFLQQFEARVGATVDPPVVVIEGATKKKTTADPASMVTADGSASGAASGEAVFVGYGITATALSWDDYAGADVAGKIVIVLQGAPRIEGKDKRPDVLRDFGSIRYKLRTAREHKAAGVVLIARSDELPTAPNDSSSMGIPGIVVKRSAAKAWLPAAAPDDQKKTWDVTKPSPAKPLAKTTVAITTNVKPVTAPAWNVVGMIPARDGSKTASEWIVVGAHYDHLGHGGTSASRAPGVHAVHPGADDNASGTALLLEAARRFAALPSRPARNILFMGFGAEEIGTIGSRFWVEHAPFPVASVAAMINADMVGRLRDNKLLVDGTGTAAAWPEIAKASAAGLGLEITFGGEGFGASDQASFTAARVPVTFLFTGVHEDYHKPTDTADKINVEGVERVATLASRMALSVAERDGRLAFVDAPADPHRSSRGGFRVSLGTVPDYAFAGKGMKLSGVRPDAPAARAGLQAGDIILKVGTHDITNVHDFMYSLGDLEPGREVVVEVERNGARVPLKVIPAPGNR